MNTTWMLPHIDIEEGTTHDDFTKRLRGLGIEYRAAFEEILVTIAFETISGVRQESHFGTHDGRIIITEMFLGDKPTLYLNPVPSQAQ